MYKTEDCENYLTILRSMGECLSNFPRKIQFAVSTKYWLDQWRSWSVASICTTELLLLESNKAFGGELWVSPFILAKPLWDGFVLYYKDGVEMSKPFEPLKLGWYGAEHLAGQLAPTSWHDYAFLQWNLS